MNDLELTEDDKKEINKANEKFKSIISNNSNLFSIDELRFEYEEKFIENDKFIELVYRDIESGFFKGSIKSDELCFFGIKMLSIWNLGFRDIAMVDCISMDGDQL